MTTAGGRMVILPLDRDSDPGFPVDEDSLKVEQWLDSHPDFVQDYFSRRATRALIDGWLYEQSGESQAAATGGNPLGIDASPAGSNSRPGSGANTPVRKISVQEFDRRGQVLKPMLFTVDGLPSFSSASCVPESSLPKPRRRRSELKVFDERELMYELLLDICNDLDMTSLYHKILQNVCILLGADRCSLFLVEGEKNSSSFCLCSKLFDVSIRSTIQDSTRLSQEIRVPWGTGIVGHVALTGEALNIPEAYEDPRFNKDVDQRTGYKTRNILCMPVKDFHGQVIGVAQAINKSNLKSESFNNHDEKVFKSYLAFCGVGIMNAKMYERSVLENRRSQLLLDLAWLIFEEQSNVAKLIHKIMLHTQSLLRCQRCQVLLVDEANQGKFSQIFDLEESDLDNDDSYRCEGNLASRFPLNIGITGHVAVTGETLNIPDAYLDNRFDPEVDKNGFRTKDILCMPVKNAQGVVIAVVQLVNKLDGTAFSVNDENLFEAFAVFCGMGISNTHMYEKAVRAMARQRVALDVLSYHSSATSDEVQRLKKMNVPSVQQYSLVDYHFSDFGLDDDDTLKATVRMFLDLRLLEKFHISYDVFLKWLLSVKKNYRAVAYHNWRHAFNVTQTMFAMFQHGRMNNVLHDLESLALLVGCLSHDLDHRGTNNQFQIKTMSPLAQLYSTSTMERHHFDHCLMIVNTKGNEILANLNEDDYKTLVGMLEEAILATDLALYFKNRCEFFRIMDRDTINWNDDGHRTLLRGMMMTACDLSAITKPWQIQQKVAELIASEFFEQGDLEKKELKEKPIDMMDRDKKSLLPVMQISFIDSICLPLYQAFAKFNVAFQPLMEGCQSNRSQWQQLAKSETRDNDGTNARENTDKGGETTSES